MNKPAVELQVKEMEAEKEPGPETSMLDLDNLEKSDRPRPSVFKKYGGMMMAFLASIFFSSSFFIINILVKSGMPAIGCSVLFNIGIVIPCLIAIYLHEKGPGAAGRTSVFDGLLPLDNKLKKKCLIILTFLGCLQGISVVCRSFALLYLPIGDMAVIVFSSPVVTTILAHFIVGEQLSCIFILIALYTLLGVGLITKPPFITGEEAYSTDTLIGSGLAIGALIALSLIFAVMRTIKNTHAFVKTLFLGSCGFLITLPVYFIMEKPFAIIPTSLEDCFLVTGLLSAFFAIHCNNIALQLESAGIVALVRSFDVIFAFLLQFVFLGIAPDIFSSIGGAIVVSAVGFSGLQKWWQERATNRRNQVLPSAK